MTHVNGVPAPGILDRELESSSRVDEITDRLVTALAIGEYLPGARLPAERELAASLRVGRIDQRPVVLKEIDDFEPVVAARNADVCSALHHDGASARASSSGNS